MEKQINKIKNLWSSLYLEDNNNLLDSFIDELRITKDNTDLGTDIDLSWYKDSVVYSLYVDLFNEDFDGLIKKLPYLKDLGVSCIWLLPVLESPMKDAGFDISNYRKIRQELVKENKNPDQVFDRFLKDAAKLDIKVIFDIAINHTSDQHDWFKKSCLPQHNKYTDFYIWSDTDKKYSDARIIFKGMCKSNWEKFGDKYYFHRFFEFQPDLNYRNPEVLIEMCRNFLYWIDRGVNGFRADAIPYLWKEEGTDCENLENTHTIIKLFRAVIEYINPSVLLLAEACQQPAEVVKYMGDGDECHAGYHFPLMPQIFKSIATESFDNIVNVLTEKTPPIPQNCQWFTFLRCHDELSLELVYVSEEDRKLIHDNYCHYPLWDFRQGEGVAARLSELMKKDEKKILLSFSIMLSLPGTPVIYYGDEFAKLNDEDYYNEQRLHTGHDDTRFLVRGRMDWQHTNNELKNENSLTSKVYLKLKEMLRTRNMHKSFGRGSIEFINYSKGLSIYSRKYNDEELLIINNLSKNSVCLQKIINFEDYKYLIGKTDKTIKEKALEAYSFVWLKKLD
jgi:maltose alpha-D-glucosyltransferase / alpha-amylase